MPREVRWLRGRVHRLPQLTPPSVAGPQRDGEAVDAAAGAAASAVLALLDELLDAWSQTPPRVLRTGGLAVRDLKAASARLDTAPDHTAYLVELALISDLVADDGEVDPHWVPTAEYDAWQTEPGGERWARLALAWLSTTRAPHRVGSRTDAAAVVNALGPDAQWPPIRSLRREVLNLLDDAGSGVATPPRSRGCGALAPTPTGSPHARGLVESVLREGPGGVTGHGALSVRLRSLLASEATGRGRGVDPPHLPPPVDAVPPPGRLTAIAPDP